MTKIENRLKRKRRVRSKVVGNAERPRLSIFRSNNHIFAQLIDDANGQTLISVSDTEFAKSSKSKEKMVKKSAAFATGEFFAGKALKKRIKKVVFDRNGYKYHGRVKEFANGARKGGLEF